MGAEPEQESEYVPVQVDAVLLEILQAEISEHVRAIQDWLHHGAPVVSEVLMRALHTSSGAFVMAEVPIVADTLGLAEAYVKQLLAVGQPASAQGVAEIGGLVDMLQATLDGLRMQPAQVCRIPSLDLRLRALCDTLSESATAAAPAMTTSEKPSLFDVLGLDAMPIPEAPAVDPTDAADDSDRLDTTEQAHADDRQGLDISTIEAVLLDTERRRFERAEFERVETERGAVIGAHARKQCFVQEHTLADNISRMHAPQQHAPEENVLEQHASQEQVRISADFLDRLSRDVSELEISRIHQQQWFGAFRATVSAIKQITTRVRGQPQHFEAEAEAQAPGPSRALAESGAELTRLQATLDELAGRYQSLLLHQSRMAANLQENLARARQLPFAGVVPQLRRVLHQAAAETGKQVQLRLDGTQTDIDRDLLARIVAPLQHLMRNAVVHGIEQPAQRRAAGKEEVGCVCIALRREGAHVVLEVGDDGIGLDRAAIRAQAEARGLIPAEAVLADSDLDRLILEPGFSTADPACRGIGMDGVAKQVRQLGGALEIASQTGANTRFTLRLPQSSAVTQVVLVRIGADRFAFPITWVYGVDRIARARFPDVGSTKPKLSHRHGGEEYVVHDLGKLLAQAPAGGNDQAHIPILLIRSGELRAAVAVDQVLGSREIVIQPAAPQIASISGIFGTAIIDNDSVVVVLDIVSLMRRHVVFGRFLPSVN